MSHGETVIRDQGQALCWNGKCRTYSDASGLLYNRLLWGEPPAHLKPGMTWKVQIPRAWELGPAGTETVTAIAVDEKTATVTLKREGMATGLVADEPTQVALMRKGQRVILSVTPGQAHWSGYTTFHNGVIVSDELMMERNDVLQSADTGPVKAVRRKYVLLNAAPYPTIASAS